MHYCEGNLVVGDAIYNLLCQSLAELLILTCSSTVFDSSFVANSNLC